MAKRTMSARLIMNASIVRRSRFLVGFVMLFMIWQLAVYSGVKEYILPSPISVFHGFIEQWPNLLSNAWSTTVEILAGYGLAIVVSIPLALLIAFSRLAEETVYPVVVFLQIMPKIAVAPLFIIWFGFGFMPKLLLVFLLSFFPIVVASHRRLQVDRSGSHGFRAHDRRRAACACSSRCGCRTRCRKSSPA